MMLLQVLKALGYETLRSGTRATQQNSENKECYERIESEQEIFSSEENVSCLQFAIEDEI